VNYINVNNNVKSVMGPHFVYIINDNSTVLTAVDHHYVPLIENHIIFFVYNGQIQNMTNIV
jgi:hypothetical protein